MPRKLKVYQTSIGFYDLVIASPSMKAALEAWGAASNLFHQGFAKEAVDREAIEAALEKAGIVLRRPVGSNEPFSESAAVPADLPAGQPRAQRKAERRMNRDRKGDDADAAHRAAVAYERQRRRKDEADRKKEEKREAQARARRGSAIAKAQAQLDEAARKHKDATSALEARRSAIDDQISQEEERWSAEEAKLKATLTRAKRE